MRRFSRIILGTMLLTGCSFSSAPGAKDRGGNGDGARDSKPGNGHLNGYGNGSYDGRPGTAPTPTVGVATPAPTSRNQVPADPNSSHGYGGAGDSSKQYYGFSTEPLPQSGVLASTFVAGAGISARLDDLLERGVMVGGENIRIEAFQDRERLPYSVPAKEAVALYAEMERARVLSKGPTTAHLQIALVAREGEAPVRPRMDVRLLLDRSGSMQGENWTHAAAAAHALVDGLAAGDTFGLISFSDDASLDFAPAAAGDKKLAHAAINRLAPGGSTNIGAALDLAVANAPRRKNASDVGLIVLVSDGKVTVGEANVEVLATKARGLFDKSGVITTSIGLGTDFDEQTMLSVAREGSGSYHFVRRAADVGGILEEELQDRVLAVAQALRVKVELAPGVIAKRVYGSRLLSDAEHSAVRATEVATDVRIANELGISKSRAKEDESGLRIHLPTFRRGDQHVILMELEIPEGTGSAVATVTLDCKDLLSKQNAKITKAVTVERTNDAEASIESTRRTVKRTVLAFQAGEALQASAEALQRGDVELAVKLIGERRALLDTASAAWRDPSLGKDAALLSRYEKVLAGAWGSWDGSDRQTMVMAMNYYGDRRMK